MTAGLAEAAVKPQECCGCHDDLRYHWAGFGCLITGCGCRLEPVMCSPFGMTRALAGVFAAGALAGWWLARALR